MLTFETAAVQGVTGIIEKLTVCKPRVSETFGTECSAQTDPYFLGSAF